MKPILFKAGAWTLGFTCSPYPSSFRTLLHRDRGQRRIPRLVCRLACDAM